MNIQLMPYIKFNGECEEALNMYKQILGGEVTIVNRYDNPAMNAPAEYQQKILHAEFTFSGNIVYASDAMPNKPVTRSTGDAHLSLKAESPEQGQKIFDALSTGGNVHIPFKQQFWGAWHGNFSDKFGIRWMVNAD
jgi:PhnB protein